MKTLFMSLTVLAVLLPLNAAYAEEAICQYASSASATSESAVSKAVYAIGSPDAPYGGNCGVWSGEGYSWTPQNWDIKANLTLKYNTSVNVSNLTVFGDYDMCFDSIWIMNSSTGESRPVSDSINDNCTSIYNLDNNFAADSVILETCGWSWSSTDAVQLCGSIPNNTGPSGPVCGNNITEPPEQCDLGAENGQANSACSANCTIALPLPANQSVCGNGVLEQPPAFPNSTEQCDLGVQNGAPGSGCSTDCKIVNTTSVCGNGILEQPPAFPDSIEQCDDGNTAGGDGCAGDCRTESISGAGCQYAINAEATSEQPGYRAIYATGAPDSDGNCGTAPSLNTSWEKTAWNVPSNITLTFPSAYPGNLTVFGDYDLCINRVWLWRDGRWHLVQAGNIDRGLGGDCKIGYTFGPLDFKTDKVKLETCGWSVAAIDAAKLCGSPDSYPKISISRPAQDSIVDDSEKSIILKISTDIPSRCEFHYERNFDIGDGINLSTADGLAHSYNLARPAADSLTVYYKCAGNSGGKTNPYSTMHRINFGKINSPFIEVCNWQNCSEGAASVSIDDGYHPTTGKVAATCQEKLNEEGLKGTYFLAYTNTYNLSDWSIWKKAYAQGHEIAGHSQSHNCTEGTLLEKSFFVNDTKANIAGITKNIGMPVYELTIYAWPCGNYFPEYAGWLSPYYQFARGYHINQIESKNPENFWNLKSINSEGFGDSPPDYFMLAGVTENYGDWANYVYHDTCNNPEIFDYLKTRSLWVDTVGAVSKYIKERQTATTKYIINTSTGVRFNLASTLNTTVFNEYLTMRIYLGSGKIGTIQVNYAKVNFTAFSVDGRQYVKFNIPSMKTSTIEISGLKVNVPYCGDGKANQKSEECDDGNAVNWDGCSSACKNEIKAYVVPYIGDIDGSVNPGWFSFYDKLRKWHDDNNISVGLSFYAETIQNDTQFNNIIANMYLCNDCELVLKGAGINGTDLDNMSYDEVKAIIGADREHFRSKVQETLKARNINGNVTAPLTYNQLYGRFTKTIRSAVHDLGFTMYFEQYTTDEYGYTNSLPDFDIGQYAVSFTYSGLPGPSEAFKRPNETITEILNFENDRMLYINGIKVVPLMAHQQDFRVSANSSTLNWTKWNIYLTTLDALKKDKRFRLLKPQDVYRLRHPGILTANNKSVAGNSIGIQSVNSSEGNSTENPAGNITDDLTGNITGNLTGNSTGPDGAFINATPPSSLPGNTSSGDTAEGNAPAPSQTGDQSGNGSSPMPQIAPCKEIWTCGAWSNCYGGSQARRCADANECGTATDRPATSQPCGV